MKIDLKSVLVGIVIGSFGLSTVNASNIVKMISATYNISEVSIQDKPIIFDENNKPFIYNNTAYAPIRRIIENLNCDVIYNHKNNTISIYSKDMAKVRQLKEAIEYLGVISPEKVIDIWTNGLKTRSAGTQYCVMTDSLKEKYLNSLEQNGYDFWHTGVSSPWVGDYEIIKSYKINNTQYQYDLKYNTKTSEGNYNFFVTLKIVSNGDYWKIDDIIGDDYAEMYTGYTK